VAGGIEDSTVDVIDGSTYKVVPPVANAFGLVVDPSTGTVFVSDFTGNAGAAIPRGATRVFNTVPLGKAPSAIAFNPITHLLYVVNTNDGTVTVVSGG
jgi:DNA-binding beta-propeller fold protein YncE